MLQDTNLEFPEEGEEQQRKQHGIARSAMEMELNDNNSDQGHFNDSLFHNSSIPAWRLIITSFLCWIVTSCAVAAGIGGGGLLVPLYALVLLGGSSNGNDNSSSSTKLAIPISACTILGVAVGNVAFLVTKRHPHANRPLVDYATVVLMQPGELMGVVVGVLFHTWFPDVLIVILLVLVLGLTAYKTIEKGYARWQAETRAMLLSSPALRPHALEHEEHLGLVGEDCVDADTGDANKFQAAANSDSPDVEYSTVESTDDEPDEPFPDECSLGWSAELARIEEYEARQFPHSIYAALVLMTVFLTVYSLLLNNVIVHGLDNCSPSVYWPAYWSPVLVFGIILWYFAGYNTRRYAKKVELGFQFVEGDVHWNVSTIRLLVPAAVGAGTLAGMLGIGGGMVLGPLFVGLNFEPQVGTASTGFMILFTAFSSTVLYLTVGSLPWQFALWFGAIGAIGGQTGQRLVKQVVDRTGRPSIVVCLLGAIIGLAVIIMAVSGVTNVLKDCQAGKNIWAFDQNLFVCQHEEA